MEEIFKRIKEESEKITHGILEDCETNQECFIIPVEKLKEILGVNMDEEKDILEEIEESILDEEMYDKWEEERW